MDLDGDQLLVVEVDPSARQVVVAGPGSGKTEAVAALVEHLVSVQQLDPLSEILVISFSRAAVEAVSRRLKGVDRGAIPQVVTLDSLAAAILREQRTDDLTGSTFDERIISARDVVVAEGWDSGLELVHVVVDEAQDIVGGRADLVIALIAALPEQTGFTILGDPAQAIYDFQISEDDDRPSLIDTIAALPDVVLRELRGQYRAKTRDARRAAALRGAILHGFDGRDAVEDYAAEVVPVGSVADLAPLLSKWVGRTAILTRTNGEALLVARELAAAGVHAALRRASSEQVLASWIAQGLGQSPVGRVDVDSFEQAVTSMDTPALAGELWRAARSVVRARGPLLDLEALAVRLSSGFTVPELLTEPDRAPVVVSTVHRAKGLEFENVVLVDTSAEDDADSSVRVSYVAFTRARSRLCRVGGPETWNLRRDENGRWYQRGREVWQVWGVQLRGTDVERSTPPGDDIQECAAVIATLSVGDPLEMRLDRHRSTLEVPRYTFTSGGVVVGRTGVEFGEDLARRVGTAARRRLGSQSWPSLAGARIGALETVAGPASRAGVGRWGLWLGIRPSGMLSVSWTEGADVA